MNPSTQERPFTAEDQARQDGLLVDSLIDFHCLVRIKTVDEQEAWRRDAKHSSFSAFIPPNPSQQFGNLFNAYAKAINKAYHRTGSLFQHPFRRIPVTSEAYFNGLVIYIHRNPQHHGFVEDFRMWPYSSYHALLSDKPTHLKRKEMLCSVALRT